MARLTPVFTSGPRHTGSVITGDRDDDDDDDDDDDVYQVDREQGLEEGLGSDPGPQCPRYPHLRPPLLLPDRHLRCLLLREAGLGLGPVASHHHLRQTRPQLGSRGRGQAQLEAVRLPHLELPPQPRDEEQPHHLQADRGGRGEGAEGHAQVQEGVQQQLRLPADVPDAPVQGPDPGV